MAHRLFLTLLALLTGLAAHVGPADARASQIASAQIMASSDFGTVKPSKICPRLAQLPEPGLRSARNHAAAQWSPAPQNVVLAVYAGVDRARE